MKDKRIRGDFMPVVDAKEFKSTGEATLGKAPSFQATLSVSGADTPDAKDAPRYQVKRSNYIKRFRRWIGIDPDQSDILGEYIASRVIAKLLNKEGAPELAPEVSLVHDGKAQEFMIASRYLNDDKDGKAKYVGMSLGELVEKKDGKPTKDRKKTKLVLGKAEENQLSIDGGFEIEIDGKEKKIKVNKKELYDALAASIVLGDHDLNPNNFYAVIDKKTGEAHVGRIDMGHAFNDLIKIG
ncbi:MAG: hypothetical protein ACI8ZF_000350 [Candidatus Midichloriaceae bacterium]